MAGWLDIICLMPTGQLEKFKYGLLDDTKKLKFLKCGHAILAM